MGIIGPYPEGSECAFEVRALFNDGYGALREGPATGSLNASLAQWLFATGRATSRYTVSQGSRLGHKSRIEMSIDADGQIWAAGSTTVCITGEVGFGACPAGHS
jgi:predicted PhzF superfamily epimerase YddE/YHI9